MLPAIETKRIILRPIRLTDAFDMYEYACDIRVGPAAGWKPHESINETKEIIDKFINAISKENPGVYSIIWKDNNKMVGTIELFDINEKRSFGEIGYALNPQYWGKGIVPESVKGILKLGFESLNLNRIQVRHRLTNYNSQRVIEKIGFKKEGVLRDYSKIVNEDRYEDSVIYSILEREYTNKELHWQKEENNYE